MRRRLMHWYAKLKALEASFDINANAISLPETKMEVERIEDAVSHIRFPLTFTDQLYNLRSHIDIVRRKIASRANTPGSMAADEFHLAVAASGELAQQERSRLHRSVDPGGLNLKAAKALGLTVPLPLKTPSSLAPERRASCAASC